MSNRLLDDSHGGLCQRSPLGRKFKNDGREILLINPRFVKPFVRGSKNDAVDAAAIYEAATRPSEDHCVVLLIGSRLTQRIHNPEARGLFSPATRAQLELGKEVTEQIRGQPLAELEEVMDLCLSEDEGWVEASKDAIVNANEAEPGHIEPATIFLRQAFDAARLKRFDKAKDLAQRAVASVSERRAKDYLKQQLAEYIHHSDPIEAQEIQLSAVEMNRALIRPLQGITYIKLEAPRDSQAVAATAAMKRHLEKNELILWVNALIEALAWGEPNSKLFERAMRDLGEFLGFGSQTPEDDYGKGSDNLWSLGGLDYLEHFR